MNRTCKQCGKEFELTDSEIRFYKSKGLELPRRCQSCRNQNKRNNIRTEQSDKEQRHANVGSSMNRPLQNSGNDGGSGNSKSYVMIAVAAAILFFTISASKNLFTLPTEDVSATADQAPVIIPRSEEQELSHEVLSDATRETSGVIYQFRKAQYLTEHFEKHGDEFPYSTEEEYLSGANSVIQNPEALHKLEAEDGDDVYYVERTEEFVVVSTDGFIRTYFKADLDYYNRQ